MIEPENRPFDDKEGEDAVNNLRQNENSAGGSADMPETNPSDLERLDQATKASEAAFTLEPEKGIPPAPENYNSDDEQDGHNVKH